jgi:hypothetical protein
VQIPRTTDCRDMLTNDALRKEVVRLAPWHLKVEINDEVSTEAIREGGHFIDARKPWRDLMLSIYPDGLAGRTLLDCACNCGGYTFWSKELGASGGLGFDARQHWIDQARFLRENRSAPSDGLRFEICDIYELPSLTNDQFDICLFKGIFYHLPDPIHAVKLVADRTRELIVINTEARNDLPEGMLVASREGVAPLMSGVHGWNWHPTGPGVVAHMLESVGFAAARCTYWDKNPSRPSDWSGPTNLGRLEVLGARDESLFEHFDRGRLDRAGRRGFQ